jgi:ribonucrease Y
LNTLFIVILTSAITLIAGFFILKLTGSSLQNKYSEAQKKADQVIKEATLKAQKVEQNAEIKLQEEMLKTHREFDEEMKSRREEQLVNERRLIQKEEHLETREAYFVEKENEIQKKNQSVEALKAKLDNIYQQQVDVLEKVANMDRETAKKLLMENMEREIKKDMATLIKETELEAHKIAKKKSREIVAQAIQRCALDHVVEVTTSVVQLPSDDMKGRIIGREGRNIRAFETSTGVDLVVDDTPEAVILSAFDPIRRELARRTLLELVGDGRIHPARIEEVYNRKKGELLSFIIEKGEEAAMEVDVQNLSPKIIELIGRLYFRTSYGQNVLMHSVEVAHLASFMAQELGVNERLAKRAAFLHDIGKAIDFEQEGTHAQLGANFVARNGESDEVVHAILAHHEEVQPQTIEAILVFAADAISASRPGARRESLEAYVKRLQKLEAVATSFNGVDKAFAIQAGREIRIMVMPDILDDAATYKLSRDVAKKIEQELEYPGTIKVTVIRETRVQEIAK